MNKTTNPVGNVVAWLAAFVPYFALNFIFRNVLMAKFYDEQLGGLSIPASQTNPLWFALASAITCFGITYVTSRDSQGTTNGVRNGLTGAVVGFVAGSSFNFSNLAFTNSWPTTLAFMDILWTSVLGGIAGFAATFAWKRFSSSTGSSASNDSQNFRKAG